MRILINHFFIHLLALLISVERVVKLLMILSLCSKKVKKHECKTINLMSRVSETKILVQFESRECKCGLNESV